jgi:HlyD family secretion protein
MKRYKWILWVVIIGLAGAGVWYWKFREKEVPVVLETEKPKVGYISSSVTATGTVQPVDTVSVGTQVSGTIANVFADFNSKVKKGQLIAELDKSLLQAQAQQITANLQQAKSQLIYQESNYNRQKQLFDLGAISKAEFETALFQFQSAKDNVTSVASQLQAAQRNLSFASIYSPIDGTVMARNVSVGQTVAASFSTPTLFVIAKDLTKMQVRASVDEADIGNVKKGQRVTFTVDAFPDDLFEGTVKDIRLQPSVAANVVTYVTLVDAPNSDLKLKPGMTASITLFTHEIQNALLISAKATKFKPDSALLKNYTIEGKGSENEGRNKGPKIASDKKIAGDLSTGKDSSRRGDSTGRTIQKTSREVVWVKKDSTISRRVIQTGLNDNANVQVLSGLSENDVVVSGVEQAGAKEATSTSARSPFMPARRGGGGGGGGGSGGSRPAGSRQ